MPEEKYSPYTEADLKLKRIHQLQTRINECNINLLKFDEIVNQFNYQIKFNLLNTLYSEVHAKCEKDEKKIIERMRMFIFKLLDENPPHKIRKEINYPHKNNMKFNKDNFFMLQEILFKYETTIRDLIEKYYPAPKGQIYEEAY